MSWPTNCRDILVVVRERLRRELVGRRRGLGLHGSQWVVQDYGFYLEVSSPSPPVRLIVYCDERLGELRFSSIMDIECCPPQAVFDLLIDLYEDGEVSATADMEQGFLELYARLPVDELDVEAVRRTISKIVRATLRAYQRLLDGACGEPGAGSVLKTVLNTMDRSFRVLCTMKGWGVENALEALSRCLGALGGEGVEGLARSLCASAWAEASRAMTYI